MSGFGFCKNNYLSVDGWVPKEKFWNPSFLLGQIAISLALQYKT
jgi:hypothetical protein